MKRVKRVMFVSCDGYSYSCISLFSEFDVQKETNLFSVVTKYRILFHLVLVCCILVCQVYLSVER